METAVHQGRMKRIGAQFGFGLREYGRDVHFRERHVGVRVDVHRTHPLECRTVAQADRGGVRVQRCAGHGRLREQIGERGSRQRARVAFRTQRATARQQAAGDVERPRFVGHAVARFDREARGAHVDREAEQFRMLRLKHHRQADFEVLDSAALRAEMHARGGERHFDVARAREGHAAINDVIRQQRQTGRIELIFPGERVFAQTVTEQWMLAAAIDQVVSFSGRAEPIAFVLPRIGR